MSAVCYGQDVQVFLDGTENTRANIKSTETVTTSESDNHAEIRFRVVDSSILESLRPDSKVYAATKKELDDAKALGAIEKSTLAQMSLDRSQMLAWRPPKSVSIVNTYSQTGIRQLQTYSSSGFLDGLLKQSGSNQGGDGGVTQRNDVLPRGEITLALPGLTKTVPSSAAKIDKAIALRLLMRDSASERQILKRAGNFSELLNPEIDARVVVSTEPLRATGPVTTYTYRVPCQDLVEFSEMLRSPGSELKSAPCSNQAPAETLMDIQMDQTLNPGAGFDAIPDSAFMTRMAAILRTPQPKGTPVPLLVVIDDGFPSQDAYRDTKEFFEEADQMLLSTYGIRQEWLSMPTADLSDRGIQDELKQFQAATTGPRGKPGCEVLSADACSFHAKSIAKSGLLPVPWTPT